MNNQVHSVIYKNEIKYVEKYKAAACALDQLHRQDLLAFKELYKVVDACLEEKMTQKKFKQCIKGMINNGLVFDKFTNDMEFKITLTPIGKDVYRVIRVTNHHLTSSNHI